MPETLPTTTAAEARSRRRHPPLRATEAEVLALVERAARLPDGLALLEGGLLECVAVLLGVDPRALERARAALQDPALRAEAGRHHLRLTGGRRAAPAVAPEPPARAPRDPQALLLAALARDGGVALLLSGSLEAAAIAFGVHPELVHRAREAAGPVPPFDELPPRRTSAPV